MNSPVTTNFKNNLYYFKFWLLIFLFILVTSLLIQLIILPQFFPQIHAGDGLLIGGDWVRYHQIALELAEKISIEGWSAWELRPEHQAPAGIAAAIYTITGISKPWTFLPLNAAFHASAAIVLLLIVKKVTGRERNLAWVAVPFAFFPTAFHWNASMHKDGFFILGSFLFIFGFLLLITPLRAGSIRELFSGLAALVAGMLLVWIVRPYGTEMLLYIAFTLVLVMSLYYIRQIISNRLLLVNLAVLWLALFSLYPLTETGVHHEYVDYSAAEPPGLIELTAPAGPVVKLQYSSAPVVSADSPEQETAAEDNRSWQPSLLPHRLDSSFYSLSVMRDRYIFNKPDAGSNIDMHVRYFSISDILLYVPRALQIGLLAPFPDQWFESGQQQSTTIMRRIAALEMSIIYPALLFSLLAFWQWRKKPDLYIVYGFAGGMILAYALVVVNVGTLYRMRYGFLMVLVAFGVAAFLKYLEDRKTA